MITDTLILPDEDTTLDAVWGQVDISMNTNTISKPKYIVKGLDWGSEETTIGSALANAGIEKVKFVGNIDKTQSPLVYAGTGNDEEKIVAWRNPDDGGQAYIGSDGTITLGTVFKWFIGDAKFTEVDFNGVVDTNDLISMESMFTQGEALESLKLTGFDTSNVTNMKQAFSAKYDAPLKHWIYPCLIQAR